MQCSEKAQIHFYRKIERIMTHPANHQPPNPSACHKTSPWCSLIPSALTVAVLAFLLPFSATGQDVDRPSPDTVPESARKYFEVLQKTPSRDYLFDRFIDAWLEERSLSQLEEFLNARASAPNAGTKDHLLAGFYFSRNDDADAALKLLRKALLAEPGHAKARLECARIAIRRLEYDAALTELDQMLALPKLDRDAAVEAGKLKARCLSRLNRFPEALKTWQDLLAAYPEDEWLHEDVIDALAAEGKQKEAISFARNLLGKTTDPHKKVLRQLRIADLENRAGLRKEALDRYAETLPQAGADSWLEREILARVEVLFRRADQFGAMRKWVDARVEAEPRRVRLRRSQAELTAEAGDVPGAIDQYLALLAISPGKREIQNAFVDLLERSGRMKEAIEQQRIVAAKMPKAAGPQWRLAELFASQEDFTSAGDSLQRFLEAEGRVADGYLRAARFLEKYDQGESARAMYRAGLAAHPEDRSLLEAEAAFLLGAGETEAALDRYRSFVKKATLSELHRLCRRLRGVDFAGEALEFLESRAGEFSGDHDFLSLQMELHAEAKGSGPQLEALAFKSLALAADSPQKLAATLEQIRELFSRPGGQLSLIEQLENRPGRTPAETALLALLMSRNGKVDGGNELLVNSASAATADADRIFLLRQRVLLLRSAQRWDEAAKAAEALLEASGKKDTALYRDLTELSGRAGRAEDALKWAGAWKQLSPGIVAPWLAEAKWLRSAGREAEAMQSLRRAVSRFPQDKATVLRQLAELQRKTGYPSEAARNYWKLYEESQSRSERLGWVAQLHEIARGRGAVENLIGKFEARRQSNASSLAPLFSLAEIHRREEDWAARETVLRQAARLAPDDLSLVHALADTQLRQGNWQSSLVTLKNGVALDRTRVTRQRIAQIEIEFGDPANGFRQLTELAAELEKPGVSFTDTIEDIAGFLIANGNPATAADYLESYFESYPDNYRLHYLRAVALEEAGNERDAVDAFLALLDWRTESNPPKLASLDRATRERWLLFRNLERSEEPALPKAVEIWEHADRLQRSAYAHHGVYRPALGQTGDVHLPLVLSDLGPLALCHLRELFSLGSAELAGRILKGVEKRKLPLATIVLPQYAENGNWNRQWPVALIRQHGDSADVQAYWILNTLMLRDSSLPGVSREDVSGAIEAVRDSHPELAAGAAIHGAKAFAGPEIDAAYTAALEQLEAIRHPESVTDSLHLSGPIPKTRIDAVPTRTGPDDTACPRVDSGGGIPRFTSPGVGECRRGLLFEKQTGQRVRLFSR